MNHHIGPWKRQETLAVLLTRLLFKEFAQNFSAPPIWIVDDNIPKFCISTATYPGWRLGDPADDPRSDACKI